MFTKPTVIVLGAGASCHYGYPTGEELVQEVIGCTEALQRYCKNRERAGFNENDFPSFMKLENGVLARPAAIAAWREQIAKCDVLINRLRAVEPVVIDYFLGWNEPLHDLGRMMIAAALLRREVQGAGAATPTSVANPGKNNWIRFIVHQLMMECRESADLLKNKVHFITFNYDRSFERNLKRALQAVGFLNSEHIDEFLADPRIVHMYGALKNETAATKGQHEALEVNFEVHGSGFIHNADGLIAMWEQASGDLCVIDPHKNSSPVQSQAQEIIRSADRTYFFGYAFDPENNRRLGLPIGQTGNHKRYFFTNFRNSGTVNIHAADAFQIGELRSKTGPVFMGDHRSALRSERNCYDAIALDFGMLSEAT